MEDATEKSLKPIFSHGEGCPLAPPHHWLNEASDTGSLWGISCLALTSHQLVGLSAFSTWAAAIPRHGAHSHVLVWPRTQQPRAQTKTPLLGPPAGSESSSTRKEWKIRYLGPLKQTSNVYVYYIKNTHCVCSLSRTHLAIIISQVDTHQTMPIHGNPSSTVEC